jgi:hypothetical protein
MRWIGFCAALLCACGRVPGPSAWVADGGAGVLARLDGELLVEGSLREPGVALLAADAGGVWLATRGELEGRATRLVRRANDLAGGRELAFGGLLALAVDGAGVLFALDLPPGGRARLWRIEAWGTRRFLAEFAGVTTLACGTDELLLGGMGGELYRLRRDGAVLEQASVAGAVRALASGGERGVWLVLHGEVAPRVTRRARGGTEWSLALAADCSSFALEADREELWLVEGHTLVRFDSSGGRQLERSLPRRGGPWRVIAARGARAWLAGTGAMLVVDSCATRAWIAGSQGGFDEIVAAVSPAAAAAPPPAESSRLVSPPRRAPGAW